MAYGAGRSRLYAAYGKEQAKETREIHEKLGWEYKFWDNEVLDLYKDDKFLKNYSLSPIPPLVLMFNIFFYF